MTNHVAPRARRSRRGALVATAAALLAAAAVAVPQAAHGERTPRPEVPADLAVPTGHKAFARRHAVGTQNYLCRASGSGFAWTLFGPQATLFDDDGDQVMTHFLSPSPDANGTPRATWQHSRESSAVWGRAAASSTDPAFVAPGAIPWLKVEVVGAEPGPSGGDKLTATTFIQRVNTAGGAAPSTGCAAATDTLGATVLVPYETDYVFFKAER